MERKEGRKEGFPCKEIARVGRGGGDLGENSLPSRVGWPLPPTPSFAPPPLPALGGGGRVSTQQSQSNNNLLIDMKLPAPALALLPGHWEEGGTPPPPLPHTQRSQKRALYRRSASRRRCPSTSGCSRTPAGTPGG